MPPKLVDLRKLSPLEKKVFREKYQTFFFDKDGTLIQMKQTPIEGATEGIDALSSRGKELYVFTDNCFQTREHFVQSFARTFPQFKQENIISAAWLLAQHLKDIGFSKKIYAIGEATGIIKELKDAGFDVITDQVRQMEPKDLSHVEFDPEVGAVVLGVDINFSYLKLFTAVNYLRDPSVLYFISHIPTAAFVETIHPIAGALSLPIEKVSGRKPTTCGKGSPASVEFIRSLGHDMNSCLFVGDVITNDIACGNLCGMDTLLVLSGDGDLDSVERARQRGENNLVPKYFADSIAVFADIFRDS